jgi:glycosyltransferase involved in cell wall biosynthesis
VRQPGSNTMKVLISVISYNEEANIEATLRDLLDNNFGYDIVVIDNGSIDRTGEICERLNVPVVRHCVNTGSSVGTLLSYFSYAYAGEYDVLCQFDADGQHVASELPKLISPIVADQADISIGSRFIERVGFQSTPTRRVGIWMFSNLFTWVTGSRVTDITSGFRAYNRDVIEFFGHAYRDPIYDSMNQFLLLAVFAGLRVCEIPTLMQPRQFGESEFNFWNSVTFPVKGVMAYIACLLQRERIRRLRSSISLIPSGSPVDGASESRRSKS